ncbi:DUF739 family protein [Staphylococcus aureus]|uniref:77ORF077 n=1 Tax=Biseptimavirus bv77 TaxID=259901 RepID=Q6R856_9CAUD|nr:DUF739 family protein [Staphylococcus aureus]NP_958627.1 DUF739 family protein [Staphylococcus phage 77]AAR87930.1 77ORF077 [Staphylococcus phage 77]EHT76480.1 hypothetical protein SACIG149_2170 [Staphylococcus aureus subsp. aureus CIG149]ELI7089276.1 DUF739 family protein [Staphylococcus aureus]EMB4689017.1 DUF739 family protein [Staphylococcus aureus]ENL95534.1 hypothetical protein WUS_00033 [Staphylococcus aureus M1034]
MNTNTTFDFSLLNGKIVEVYSTQFNFAIALGVSERTLSLKLNNKVPWKTTDIIKACKLLGIPIKDVHKYFFKQKVQMFELNK